MTLKALIVDDEALARSRLRTLLGDCQAPACRVEGEAANAPQAVDLLRRLEVDLVLLDIHMPGADGLTLAETLCTMERPPALVFVTAHAEHAVQAFELEAVDYLTKPVRLERLQQALLKVQRHSAAQGALETTPEEYLLIQERGRTERIALSEVLYFKAELKYITVRTEAKSYILDGSLSELEDRYAGQFLRIHRNALVSRRAVRALEKHYDADEGAEGWAVRLNGADELLSVSRRQLAAVREMLGG